MAAEAGATQWRAATLAQRSARSDHTDFYELAAELSATLHALNELTRILGRQVAGYGHERPVYDDSRQVDPHLRLAEAGEHLAATTEHLSRACRSVNAYWSAIAHIGVEVTHGIEQELP